MPTEFLTDAQEQAHRHYVDPRSNQQLAVYFHLDDADLELANARRGAHNKLGFASAVACRSSRVHRPAADDQPTGASDPSSVGRPAGHSSCRPVIVPVWRVNTATADLSNRWQFLSSHPGHAGSSTAQTRETEGASHG